MSLLKTSLAALAFGLALPIAAPTHSQSTAVAETALPSGDFVRKSKRLEGSYSVIERDGQTIIRFSSDFRAAGGPDLKVFLSPRNVSSATGSNATSGAIKLGALEARRGSQDYLLPEGVDLADFASVLVHCEAYSVLWGGADI